MTHAAATSKYTNQDTLKLNIVDQKPFVDQNFNGNASLTAFIDDLKTESITRRGWEDLHTVRCANSTNKNLGW